MFWGQLADYARGAFHAQAICLLVETHQGVLFVNPGSTSMVKQSMKLGTVALLELTGQGAEARIVELARLSE